MRPTFSTTHLIVALVALLLMLAVFWPEGGSADRQAYGAYGPEGDRFREQLWILPGSDPNVNLRTTVFRPTDTPGKSERRPLVVINHGTSEATRLSVSMPVYYWLSRWFVERGYVVALPQRRGHGATGGPLAESIGDCADPDHLRSGLAAAEDIEAAIRYMTRQPFIRRNATVVVGASTGGWAALALASRNPSDVRAVVNFAGGRGGHKGGRANAVCGQARLIDAAGIYGGSARIPTIWFYARSDSYFSPKLAASMAKAWEAAGGLVELHTTASYGNDGHSIVENHAGWRVWGPALDRFLASLGSEPKKLSVEGFLPTVY